MASLIFVRSTLDNFCDGHSSLFCTSSAIENKNQHSVILTPSNIFIQLLFMLVIMAQKINIY